MKKNGKIHFSISRKALFENRLRLFIRMFTNPQKNGSKQSYTITGEPYWFTNDTGNSLVMEEQELPAGLVYSFHHGLNEIECWSDELTDWTKGLSEKDIVHLNYREVSPEDVETASRSREVEFNSLEDVRNNKHLFRAFAFTDKQIMQLHRLTNTKLPTKRQDAPDMWPLQCQLQARALFNKITNNVPGKMHNRR